ncbi:glycoside hydrolase family 15 protein [Nitrospira sp. BLG_2]|uniref:glycoside hydrolase family 15 protein n=1 Tax=Nitrospira sp. BLG_2 TaxID=3397507 RepID=UPI003B9B5F81
MHLEDYALIGDTHTAALIGRNGSIDWLCLPRFDSNACFAALLGNEQNGRWIIAPADQEHRVTRRYRSDTLILETDFTTKDGTVRVVDCMPLQQNHPTIVRLVIGVHGSVRVHMQLILRFDYGSVVPWVTKHADGLQAIAGPDSVYVITGAPTYRKHTTRMADFDVEVGQQVSFVLLWHPSHEPVPSAPDAAHVIEETTKWWRQWTSRCHPVGEHREAVVRSLITLKALTNAPTGGIVAAPTTSLPERLGGVRNWDYRYCWIRDATYTLYALLTAGYKEEASNWRDWLIRTVAGDPSQLQIMYGIAGERRLTELELPWLSGYEKSTPVRTGNDAWHQLQLDVFGEVMDTLHQARRTGMETNERGWAIQTTMMEYLESKWKEPDEGIWEVRGPRRHFTHSKVMAWVAMDRMVQDIEMFRLPGDAARWKRVREEIHQDVCGKGFDPSRNTFTQYYGSRQVDAGLLMIPLVGFLSPHDPRVQGTVQTIEKELFRDGLVQRYSHQGSQSVDGLPAGEGTFLACSFWLVNTYVLQDRHTEAEKLFQRLLALRNDLGLLSEEYDTGAKRLVGNFPQALSHLSLVNTAYTLASASGPSQHRQRTGQPASLESWSRIER